jgi:hypothetical protein
MLKSALGKVMWVGRATVFLVGLAVILAVALGVASTAFGADGQPFFLGRTNVASTMSTLIKQGPGAALSLQVQSGSPPLAVNSSTKVTNLNADQLDGKHSSELSSAYFFGTENHFDLSSSGGGDQDVATLSGLPAGEYLVNANVAAVNFHTPDFSAADSGSGGITIPAPRPGRGTKIP